MNQLTNDNQKMTMQQYADALGFSKRKTEQMFRVFRYAIANDIPDMINDVLTGNISVAKADRIVTEMMEAPEFYFDPFKLDPKLLDFSNKSTCFKSKFEVIRWS